MFIERKVYLSNLFWKRRFFCAFVHAKYLQAIMQRNKTISFFFELFDKRTNDKKKPFNFRGIKKT